jgi:hypothetical protein
MIGRFLNRRAAERHRRFHGNAGKRAERKQWRRSLPHESDNRRHKPPYLHKKTVRSALQECGLATAFEEIELGYSLMAQPLEKYNHNADCGIPDACERMVPRWLIILDNVPTIVMFILGSVLLGQIGAIFSILFLAYCGLSIVLFWYLICPWCHHFGKSGCPCGYGRISSQLFERRTGKEFKRVFRRNIVIVFPCWITPVVAGFYLVWTEFTWTVFYLLLSFCFVGFILIPAVSRFVGCKSCKIKNECPWMLLNARRGR